MNDRMDSRSKCLILIISSRKTQEKYTDDLRSPEWTPGDKTLIMETPRKIIKILSLLAKILSRKFVLLSSILVARRQMRALYSLPEHSARNALISSRYSGLWGRFLAYFHPPSPYETLEMCILAWSLTLRSSSGVGFCHEMLSFMITNGRIRSLRLESSPRVSKTPQK